MVRGGGVICAVASPAGVARVVVDPSITRNEPDEARDNVEPETVIGAPPGSSVCPEMTKVGPAPSRPCWPCASCCGGLFGPPESLCDTSAVPLVGRAVNVEPSKTSSGRMVAICPGRKPDCDSTCVELPTTTKTADESRLIVTPSTTAVPPGTRICPGPIKNCVAAFGTNVEEPIVKIGGVASGDS